MELSREYEEWELDEFISILVILPFGFAAFAFRRWQDLNYEVKERVGIEETLRKVSVLGDRLQAQCGNELSEQGRDYVDRIVRSIKNMSGFIAALQMYSVITTRPGKFKDVNLDNEIAVGLLASQDVEDVQELESDELIPHTISILEM